MWPFSRACTVGLFESVRTLLLICAQSGRVTGLERKTYPASSESSSRKVLKVKNNRLSGIGYKFCIPFDTKSTILFCGGGGGVDSDCTVMTLHRMANFPLNYPNSDTEWTRRGIIVKVLLFILLLLVFQYSF